MDSSRWAALALAAPGCLLAAASTVALMMGAVDHHPMWPHQPTNLAESAGVRDEAEVVRLIERGDDPNARYAIRQGLIFDFPIRLTPLEAAVAADDAEMIRSLFANGAVMDAALWTYLRCIAEGDRVPPTLDEFRPSEAVTNCDEVRSPWRPDTIDR